MKYCPHCGTPFAEDATICPNCGRESAPIAFSSAQQSFPNYNQPLQPSPSNPGQAFERPLPPNQPSGQPIQPTPPPAFQGSGEHFSHTPGAYSELTVANPPLQPSGANSNPAFPPATPYNTPSSFNNAQNGAFQAPGSNFNQSFPQGPAYNPNNVQNAIPNGAFPPSAPQGYPGSMSYPAGAPGTTFPQQGAPKRGLSSRSIIALIVAAAIILLSVLGIAGYNGIYLPQQRQAHAQATAFARGTSEAHSTATSVQQTAIAPTVSAQQTATAAAIQAQKDQQEYNQVTSGSPALNDPLQDDSLNNWTTNQTCAFVNNAYVATTNNGTAVCAAPDVSFDNFAYQIHMNIVQGDSGGLLFRSNVTGAAQIYALSIDIHGAYAIAYETSSSPNGGHLVGQGTSKSFHTGLNQDNEIMIVANGDTFDLFINKHHEGKYTYNGSSSSGFIGVVAASNQDSTTTQVQYTNAKVWKLGQQS